MNAPTLQTESLCKSFGGRPIVKAVTRTRAPDDTGDDASRPPADLVVTWDPGAATDVVDCGRAGRIGPVPWLRTGDHVPDGFCVLRAPGVAPGSALREDASVVDLTATLERLLGMPAAAEGRPLA